MNPMAPQQQPTEAVPNCDLFSPENWSKSTADVFFIDYENFTLAVFNVINELWEWRLCKRDKKDNRRILLFSDQVKGKDNAIKELHACFNENYQHHKI